MPIVPHMNYTEKQKWNFKEYSFIKWVKKKINGWEQIPQVSCRIQNTWFQGLSSTKFERFYILPSVICLQKAFGNDWEK